MSLNTDLNELERLLRFSRKMPHTEKLVAMRIRASRDKPDESTEKLFKQRVVVKSSIRKVRMTDKRSLHSIFKKHIHYIGRDGTGIDGNKPELFTRSSYDTGLPSEELDHVTRKIWNEEHFFKFIISPDHGSELELKEYTRDVMESAERTIGKKLDWIASCHYNTDNPHVHVVVRGVSEGQQLFIDKQFMFEGLRNIAIDRATHELGHRSELEIAIQKSKEITSERFTGIDKQIKTLFRDNSIMPVNDTQKQRCDHLERLGLAIKEGKNVYRVADNFEQVLKENGYRNDIHKRMFHDIPDNTKPVFIYKNTMSVSGKVVAKDFENEQIEKPYVFIETKDKIYYHADYKLERYQPGQDITIDKGKISKDKEAEKGIEK